VCASTEIEEARKGKKRCGEEVKDEKERKQDVKISKVAK
jgi:hypothetical protein